MKNILNRDQFFPQIKIYIAIALLFLDAGILFGALNSLRLANIYTVWQIHRTHWTTTLFGAMFILMNGQLIFVIRNITEDVLIPSKAYLAPLGLTLVGIFSGYLTVWIEQADAIYFSVYLLALKGAAALFFLLPLAEFIYFKQWAKLKEQPVLLLLFSALLWQFVAVTFLFGYQNILLTDMFLLAYIYGFFAFTLFGVLTAVLPWMFDKEPRSAFGIYRDTAILHVAAIFLVYNAFLEFGGDESIKALALISTAMWGLVALLFIMYVFDLMYKVGFDYSLLGLILALISFGFFVFDTFMKNIFPQWVTASHVHFMFLGTLVLTIVAVGLRLSSAEIGGKTQLSKFHKLALGLTAFFVFIILFCFTFEWYGWAGYAGIALFVSIILAELGSFRLI